MQRERTRRSNDASSGLAGGLILGKTGNGNIRCADMDRLSDEVYDWGQRYGGRQDIRRGKEPRNQSRYGDSEDRRAELWTACGMKMKKQLQTETQEKSLAYGCLFCKTGKEQSVINRIHISCPEVRAITMRKIKYRTCKKIKRTEETIVLPGYVFFRVPSDIEPPAVFPMENVIRLLSMDGDWQLHGADKQFACWLFQYDGLLGLSKAYRVDDRVRIVSGPLKDMEGKIKRVDKRGMSGQVTLSFNGKDISVWFGFELIKTIQ